MDQQTYIPTEGELHSVVTIDAHRFELRYGYCDERDRTTGEPYILYPDLATKPCYTEAGQRIVTALQGVCRGYSPPEGQEGENCCYTCRFYPDPRAEIGICGNEHTRKPSAPPGDGGKDG